MSTAKDILDKIVARVQSITVANGYNTDIGLAAEINEPQINPDDVTSKGAVVVFDSGDENIDGDDVIGDAFMVRIDLNVDAHIRMGANNAVTLAHDMVTDIKKAVLDVTDRTLSGSALDLRYVGRDTQYPDRGGDIVSVKLQFYTLHVETYGDP